jgi:hypothetical protein
MLEKARDSPVQRLPDWRLTLPLAQFCHRCGARTRSGAKCKAPAMLNGRCRERARGLAPRVDGGLDPRLSGAGCRPGPLPALALAGRGPQTGCRC